MTGLLFLAGGGVVKAQSAGDIVFTGYNSDTNEELAFMATTAIAGSTTIYFTDSGWDISSNDFVTTEGELQYTTPVGGLNQGDQVTLTWNGSSVSVQSGGGSAALGASSGTPNAYPSLGASGDALLAYTGSYNSPTFIAGIQANKGSGTDFWDDFDVDAISTSRTEKPSSLTTGTNAMVLLDGSNNEVDNGVYDCSTVAGSQSSVRDSVCNRANWSTSNSTMESSIPCAVGTSTWNGSAWLGSTPTSGDDAIIGSSTTPGTFSCLNLTINDGVALTASGTSTIAGNITNNGNGLAGTGTISLTKSGTATLSGTAMSFGGIITVGSGTTLSTGGLLTLSASSTSSYGQLVGDGSVTGNVTVQIYVDPTSSGSTGRYYYLGSPLTNAILSDFNESGATMASSNNAQGTAWEWDAANAEWDPAGGASLASTATNGVGYSIYVGMNGSYGPFLRSGAGTVSLTGTVTHSDVNSALSYNNGQSASVNFAGGTSESDTEGWNLVANPFTSVYDWDAQTIPTDMGSAIYRYSGSNYSSYTKGAGSASRYIAPGQGFFVQLTANTPGNLVFAENNRTPSQSATLTKTSNYVLDGIDLRIENQAQTVWDELYVGFENNATKDFDLDWDAHKLKNGPGVPNMYILMNNEAFSICRQSVNDNLFSFPVQLDHDIDGDDLEITADQSELKSFTTAELKDLKTNTVHNLINGPYTFKHDKSYNGPRFLVSFSGSTIGIDENRGSKVTYAYSNEAGIHITTNEEKEINLKLYDTTGRLIRVSKNVNGRHSFELPKKGQLYVIEVQSEDNKTAIKVIH